MKPKPDLVIAAIAGYGWEQVRPFAVSLTNSGFTGDKVILAYSVDGFTQECLENRGFDIVPFVPPGNVRWDFLTKHRFAPLLCFLAKHRKDYRYVVWVDAGDQIFQRNPSEWLDDHGRPHTIIAAREGWRIKDEPNWNLPWMQSLFPEENWIHEEEVLCSGTIAGDPEIMYSLISQMYQIVCDKGTTAFADGHKVLIGADQSAMNYILRKPGTTIPSYIPPMSDGWTATCASLFTKDAILIDPSTRPVFDLDRGLVLTPDGQTPFTLVHQYNRDESWLRLIHEKYRWDL